MVFKNLVLKFKEFPKIYYREKGRGDRHWVVENTNTNKFSIIKGSRTGGRLLRVNLTKEKVNKFLKEQKLKGEKEKIKKFLKKEQEDIKLKNKLR